MVSFEDIKTFGIANLTYIATGIALLFILILWISSIKKEKFVEEELNPWSPEREDTSGLDSLNSAGSYNDKLTGELPAEISQSHREYTSDSDFLATTGSSRRTEYDHDQSFLPWVAGGRRGGAVHSGSADEARTTTSYTDAQEQAVSQQNSTGITWG